MTFEEMQHTMKFIVNQQAHFTTGILSLKESQAQLIEAQRKWSGSVDFAGKLAVLRQPEGASGAS